MNKDELIQWLVSHNYHKDSYGHYQKTKDNGYTYRYKIQDISVRYERKAEICGKNEWLRIASNYLKNLSINDKNQICGLKP